MNVHASIEGVLLAYGEPLELKKLARVVGEKEESVRGALRDLSDLYLKEERGFVILEENDRFQLVSHPDCARYIKKLRRVEDETGLSRAALETLSIIAYRSPVTKAEIEMIRGVNCASLLRSLSLRGLVERAEIEGGSRSYAYRPSFSFFQLLGITKIEELPEYDAFSTNRKLFPKES